jgi:hypothetical protein
MGVPEDSMHYTDKHNPLFTTALLLTLLLALVCVGTCELYNNSMPDFVDDHTSVVWGTAWKNDLSGVVLKKIRDGLLWLKPSAQTGKDLVLVVTVANPRRLDFKADVLLEGVVYPGLGAKNAAWDQLIITIPPGVWEDGRPGLAVLVEFYSPDGSRKFEPYESIPYIEISETQPYIPGGSGVLLADNCIAGFDLYDSKANRISRYTVITHENDQNYDTNLIIIVLPLGTPQITGGYSQISLISPISMKTTPVSGTLPATFEYVAGFGPDHTVYPIGETVDSSLARTYQVRLVRSDAAQETPGTPDTGNLITSFTLARTNSATPTIGTGIINNGDNTISISVAHSQIPLLETAGMVVPQIAASPGATVEPWNGVWQNFTPPGTVVPYTVTPSSGPPRVYRVTVKEVSDSAVPPTSTYTVSNRKPQSSSSDHYLTVNGNDTAQIAGIAAGAEVTVEAILNSGSSKVKTITCTTAAGNAVSVTPVSSTSGTFTMPAGNVTVDATFTTGTDGGGGGFGE